MMGGPHLEVPGACFIALGILFIAFRERVAAGFNLVSRRIWPPKGAKQSQGFNGWATAKPPMVVVLGVAWILLAAAA